MKPVNLQLYSFLAKFKPIRRTYTGKIMLVAFLGTHIPLLALLLYFLITNAYDWNTTVAIMLVALLATLIGTGFTLYILNHLLAPVRLTSQALKHYLHRQELPKLPTKFTDEAGTLMADTSQTLHKLDELIHYISHYDNVTGLPNRELVSDRLYQALSAQKSQQPLISSLLITIDDFNNLNYVLNEAALHQLRCSIAQRLQGLLNPQTDFLGYLGKDEFVIIRTEMNSLESVISLAQLLLATLAKPMMIDHSPVHITVSIGMAIASFTEYDDIGQILQQSQMALYELKQKGRNQYQFYSPEMNHQVQERLNLERELHQAIAQDQLRLYYQPLIDLKSDRIAAVEALIRWQHPTYGLVSPAKFIPIAEANNLIIDIGAWVLRTACEQNRDWQAAGLPPIRMSVNLSARQFEQEDLVEQVAAVLKSTGLDPAHLELEVTESALMDDISRSVELLTQLRHLGTVIALDDFGTGYSSLNYLKRFPTQMLKIDRSFIQDLTTNPDSAAVADAIIALAQSLHLKITAEGIETPEQLEYLRQRGCHEGQGYYFSRPLPVEEITPLLHKQAETPTWSAIPR